MSRGRQWKDRRAWVEHDAPKTAAKYFRKLSWWKRLFGYFATERRKRWERDIARQNRRTEHYVLKKMSHGVEKNEPGEFERCKRQVARAKRRHEAFLAAHPERVHA
jgi:hypothetical protein